MLIREATAADWPAIWPFLHDIVAAGETYTYPRDLGEDRARSLWMLSAPSRTVVAVDEWKAVDAFIEGAEAEAEGEGEGGCVGCECGGGRFSWLEERG